MPLALKTPSDTFPLDTQAQAEQDRLRVLLEEHGRFSQELSIEGDASDLGRRLQHHVQKDDGVLERVLRDILLFADPAVSTTVRTSLFEVLQAPRTKFEKSLLFAIPVLHPDDRQPLRNGVSKARRKLERSLAAELMPRGSRVVLSEELVPLGLLADMGLTKVEALLQNVLSESSLKVGSLQGGLPLPEGRALPVEMLRGVSFLVGAVLGRPTQELSAWMDPVKQSDSLVERQVQWGSDVEQLLGDRKSVV